MIQDLATIGAGLLMVVGSAFVLTAAIGLLRFPDLYTRMHAASKAGTVGSGTLLIALAIASADLDIAVRAVAGAVFLLLTTPVAAHLLARSAVIAGLRPIAATLMDAETIEQAERLRADRHPPRPSSAFPPP